MSYKGKFKPIHPEKYVGDANNIVYRSLWERNVMKVFDTGKSYLAWASEEVAIPYVSPIDNKVHRYYPDFAVKFKDKNGNIKKFLIEVKPLKETAEPKLPKSGRKTKAYRNAWYKYIINRAKWESAQKWCEERGYEFKIFTEEQCTY